MPAKHILETKGIACISQIASPWERLTMHDGPQNNLFKRNGCYADEVSFRCGCTNGHF
ncbi:hypothetical protein [Lentibacter sp. XHP0401]|uniref:hypothetical protein n=1 Tax=Lentibacter sp. XHP0401 TaxID=2984334 RepID=UPI0021E8BC62|nr:hypothetical protein [Lentibacter sp. XHP0401]MCV2892994.1 hypothetical protein [Lentibacter sp. XHP0401]